MHYYLKVYNIIFSFELESLELSYLQIMLKPQEKVIAKPGKLSSMGSAFYGQFYVRLLV